MNRPDYTVENLQRWAERNAWAAQTAARKLRELELQRNHPEVTHRRRIAAERRRAA